MTNMKTSRIDKNTARFGEDDRSRGSIALLAAMLLFAACDGPFLTIPGGALEGSARPVPSDWVFTDEISTIEVETRPTDPYSINIWAVAMDDRLYLHAGANRTRWVRNLEAEPSVRVRIEGSVYDLTASRVRDPGEFADFSDAFERKYDQRPRNENVAEAYVFRLSRR